MFESKQEAERRKRYHGALEALLRAYPNGVKAAYGHFPKLKTAYKTFAADAAPEAAALFGARVVLCELFQDTLTTEQRAVLLREMQALDWGKARASVATWDSERPNLDCFGEAKHGTITIASAFLVGEALRDQGRVSDEEFGEFTEEVNWMLEGYNQDQRQGLRLRRAFDEALNLPVHRESDDDEPAMDSLRMDEDLPIDLAGKEYKVELRDTPLGIGLVDLETGRMIVERRNLSQEILRGVPRDQPPYRFINLASDEGDFCSCLIYGPEHEIAGDMRAFWWSLAATMVHVTDFTVSGARFSKNAFAAMCTAARTAWEIASEHDDIDEMRHMPSYRREVHRKALTEMEEGLGPEHQKMGVRVARALILAIASEDRNLERHAVLRFKEFIWLSGEEPPEFYEHLA